MAGEASRSNGDGPTADSYIGSLISLISKSEIRYEGLLFNINTAESSIRLRNVKSFGTEGRKRDGLQVPPSDKVYEYILFRGSDIKVKSSQPVDSPTSLYNDPAIIQSHYSQGAATSTSSQTPQAGRTESTLQSSLPLYQPNAIPGSWGLTPLPPITNSSSFHMPIHMQGFNGASEGIQTLQQSLLQSPHGMSIPPSMQQYPVNSTSIPFMTSNFSSLPFSVSTESSLPPLSTDTLNSNLIAPAQSSALTSDSSTILMSNKTPTQAHPTAAFSSNLPLASPWDSILDRSTFSTSVPDKFENVAGSPMPYDTGFKPQPSDAGTSGSLLNKGSAPLLVTPNQLLQPGPTANGLLRPGPTTNELLRPGPSTNGLLQPGPTNNGLLQPLLTPNQVLQSGSMPIQDLQLRHTPIQVMQPGLTSSQVFQPLPKLNQLLQPGITVSSSNYSSESAQKDVEVVQVPSAELPLTTPRATQAPILPLPSPHDDKVFWHHSYAHYNNRGGRDRPRGHGGLRHVTGFTEEFDFTASNEKFKKDEIWGDLGKGNNMRQVQGSQDEDHAGTSNLKHKPVYVKDDFFDSLSCNVSDRGSKNGRTNFSEQRKLDVKTFGNYARHRGGHGHSHGGRGYGHGYNSGSNGRGYGRGNNGYERSYNGYNGRGYWHHAT